MSGTISDICVLIVAVIAAAIIIKVVKKVVKVVFSLILLALVTGAIMYAITGDSGFFGTITQYINANTVAISTYATNTH